MQHNRAVQFMPFDSLKGFREYLKYIEKENDIDIDKMLYNKIKELKINDIVKVEYFYYDELLEIYGIIKEITNKYLVISNTKVLIKDILCIN